MSDKKREILLNIEAGDIPYIELIEAIGYIKAKDYREDERDGNTL